MGSHISYDDAAGIADDELLDGDRRDGRRPRSSNPPPRRSKPRRHSSRLHRSRRRSSKDDDSGTELTSYDGSDEESAKRRRRSGSRAASRRHGPLRAPHPLTPPVLYGSRGSAAPAGAPVPYGLLHSPPGLRMPRPSAPPDPGYSLAVADHAYISYVNGLFSPSAVAPAGDDDTAVVMAAAQLVEAYVRRAQAESPSRAPPVAAEWPAFSPPQAPSRARTPHNRPPAGSPGHLLPTRGQALRSLARELNAASAAAEPVAHARRPRSSDRGSGRSDAEEASAAASEVDDDEFEDFIDGDAEWIAACRAEAAQRQRSPSAAQASARSPLRASGSRHSGSGLSEPARPGRHRRTLTLT